jgi:tetratricopeptide (TPR) repeat protein
MNPQVQSFLDRFTDSNIQSMRNASGFADYATCLHSFWNGQAEETVDQVSSLLSANPDHPMRFSLYRLWLEALANRGERLSMHALHEHLLLRGEANPEDRATYMALRGIIHLEQDRPNAAKLMLRAIGEKADNPWMTELKQAVELREQGEHAIPALIHSTSPTGDYIIWSSLIRAFIAMNQRHRAESCFDIMDRIFTGNPTRDICYFHWTSELGDWSSALDHATHLANTFPQHPDFTFYSAYAAFRLNRFNQAIKTYRSIKIQMQHCF